MLLFKILTDKISGIFVPAVVILDFLLFGSGLFSRRVSLSRSFDNSPVLVHQGFATPTALMVGTDEVKMGILQNGTVLQETKVQTVVFDKTGT